MDLTDAVSTQDHVRIGQIFVELCGSKEAALDLLESSIGTICSGIPRKRVSPGFDESSNKLVRLDKQSFNVTDKFENDEVDMNAITLTILIPSDPNLISYIVGKSGVNISELQNSSGAQKIQIEKRQSGIGDRAIFIQGTLKSTVTAYQLLLARLEGRSEGSYFESSRIVIPKELVSHIIGKGGSSIKRIENTSGCHVDVQTEADMMQAATAMPGGVFGRTLSLVGGARERLLCVYYILRALVTDKDFPDQWKGRQPQPLNSAVSAMAYAAAPRVGSNMMGMGMGMVPGLPMGPPIGMGVGHMGMGGAMPPHGRPGGSPGGGAGPMTNVEIKVPSGSVSFIIGQKGSSISEIQRVTECNVMVDKSNTDGPERKITITGPLPGTSKAVEIIGQRVVEWRNSSQGGGGGGFSGHSSMQNPGNQYGQSFMQNPGNQYGQTFGYLGAQMGQGRMY